jgi:signal transduction histidine kinase
VAQLALGAFFGLAYELGRREPEYLLFGLLSVALAIGTLGLCYQYVLPVGTAESALATKVMHTGMILAVALNLHFVMQYARVRLRFSLAVASYAGVVVYQIANWGDLWWHPEFAATASQVGAASPLPSWIGISFYLLAAMGLAASVGVLLVAYLRGTREALVALIGSGLVAAAGVNDVALVLGIKADGLHMLPHAFLLYAFAVGCTLLIRYRITAGKLEQTISSLHKRTEELRHSHAELKTIQDELVHKKQLAAVGELAAAIAHEVRNPLAIIVNAVAGLRRSGIREEDRSTLLGIVEEEVGRLNRLVTDLLRFARPVNIIRSEVSLQELAQRTVSTARPEHKVLVELDEDPQVQTVWVDPGLFRLVFDNLVNNACQAMPQGGTVTIAVKRGEIDGAPAVKIQISDKGVGMEDEVLERAIDPFFTTRPSGTGLGLPIVERIVQAHGGDMVLESEQGVGTTVTLLLPLGPPAEVELTERRRRAVRRLSPAQQRETD